MNCDALIIGAGPAGISTWLHLNKHAPHIADRTVVIDKAVFPRDKVCAGGVGAWSSAVLEYLEIELDIPSLFVSDIEFQFGEELYQLEQENILRVVDRAAFDHTLVKSAVRRGIELRQGESFVDAARVRNGLSVTTTKNEYCVNAVIGADGALSLVRRKLIPPQAAHLAPTMQTVVPTHPEKDEAFKERKVVLNWTPLQEGLQGYVWHFPCLRNGIPSVAHGAGDFRVYADKPRADLKGILVRELRSWNVHHESTSWVSHPVHWWCAGDTLSQPNVLLAGDAAGIEPAFGGGIHIALTYGDIAAHTIINAFQNNDFSFRDYDQRLASHWMGRYLRDCSFRALDIYGDAGEPLRVVREFFGGEYDGSLMMSLLLAISS